MMSVLRTKRPSQKSLKAKIRKSLKDFSTGLKMPRGRKSLKDIRILKDILLEDIRLPCNISTENLPLEMIFSDFDEK